MSYTIGDTSIISEFINIIVGVDGIEFTQETANNVMKWQSAYGNIYTQSTTVGDINIVVNGIVDIYTLPAMCNTDLDLDNTSAIATAQYALGVTASDGRLEITGFLNPATRDAIKQYQSSNGLVSTGFTVPISFFYDTEDDLQIAFTQFQSNESGSNEGIIFNPGSFFLVLETQNLYQCIESAGGLALQNLGQTPSEYYGEATTGIVNIPTWNSFRNRFGAFGL